MVDDSGHQIDEGQVVIEIPRLLTVKALLNGISMKPPVVRNNHDTNASR